MRTTRFLIFDLDGTLIDSKRDIVLCVNRAFAKQRLPSLDEERVGSEIGRGARYLFQRLVGDSISSVEIDILVKHFKSCYSDHLLDHTRVYAGMEETLSALQAIPKVVVTNKNQEFADLLVDQLGLRPYFEAVYGSEAFATQKPDPGPLLESCALRNFEPDQAAVVGDSAFDILAGRAAGVRTVAALYGFSSAEELRKLAPDHEVAKPRDLASLFLDQS